MAPKPKQKPGDGLPSGRKRKTKGKRHPLHAESLDHMARETDLNRSGTYVTAVELSRILRGEAKRIRSILR